MGPAVAVFDIAADAVRLNPFRPQESAIRRSIQHIRNGNHAGKDHRLRSLERAKRLRIQRGRWSAGTSRASGYDLNRRIVDHAPQRGDKFADVFIRKSADIERGFGITGNNVAPETAFNNVWRNRSPKIR